MQDGNILPSSESTSFLVKGRKYIGNLVLVMGSLIIVFLLSEGTLSLFVPSPIVWREPQELYLPDPLLGHRLVPGQSTFTHSFPVTTNSHGFRDREFPTLSHPGFVRILCLGDSLTFGDGVAVGDTYPKQVEEFLNASGSKKYEVINTGVASYDTWQEVTFFRTRGLEFRPSTVVIGFYANDIVPKPPVVHAALNDGGPLSREGFSGLLPDVMVHLLKRSRVLLLLKDRVDKLRNRIQPSSQFLHQQALLEGTSNDIVERGWREVESSLREMAELREMYKFHFLIVIFPLAEQLMREYPNAQYQTRIKAIAEKLNIPYIDLKPRFEAEFTGFGSLFIEWDGHPNPRAHRIAAEEISRVLAAIHQSG